MLQSFPAWQSKPEKGLSFYAEDLSLHDGLSEIVLGFFCCTLQQELEQRS